MKVLALTHAHLNKRGLSPVSCERADSITGTWAERLHWDVDVVHTSDTKWVGIWPDGAGLKINIIPATAPDGLMQTAPQLFSATMKALITQRNFMGIFGLTCRRAAKRLRHLLTTNGWARSRELVNAEKWGNYLAKVPAISTKKYDFLFVCVGYGDEYLLQTALTISEQFKVPMVVDFRDLWSEHHDPDRFTEKERKLIRRQEKRLLKNTKLISVPQKHLKLLVDKWSACPVYHLPHSAYVDPAWQDGRVIDKEFRILYSGKLYASGPGISMLLDLMKILPREVCAKPVSWHFYVDETATLRKRIEEQGITGNIVINEWTSPALLWQEIRSAHLLVIIDSSTLENYPILLTKTFQYAFSGRQILCLQKYNNPEMEEFLEYHDAGLVTTQVADAAAWITRMVLSGTLYESLPPLRNIPQREDVAEQFGHEVEKVLNEK